MFCFLSDVGSYSHVEYQLCRPAAFRQGHRTTASVKASLLVLSWSISRNTHFTPASHHIKLLLSSRRPSLSMILPAASPLNQPVSSSSSPNPSSGPVPSWGQDARHKWTALVNLVLVLGDARGSRWYRDKTRLWKALVPERLK